MKKSAGVADVMYDGFVEETLPWNYAVNPETGEVIQVSSGLDERGREIPDPVPYAPAVAMTQGDSLIELVRRAVRQHVSQIADEQGYETFEEAEDFDIPDEPLDPRTPYESVFDPPPRAPSSLAPAAPVEGGAGGGGASQTTAPTPPATPSDRPSSSTGVNSPPPPSHEVGRGRG